MAKRKKIVTKNKEIYDKLNQLHYSSDVILKGVKKGQIDRIIKNVNKTGVILVSEIIGDYILIKKKNHLNFDIYLR